MSKGGEPCDVVSKSLIPQLCIVVKLTINLIWLIIRSSNSGEGVRYVPSL
ncbi:hypothetical protein C1645_839276 [Glomus cerebriforme]|uniref:Uncharacterized protein n=1 Tax=Glomus cerebriforme TaxID=658196 RepID=A0A397SBJ0_9GLOM|nr:hypothetical protein C1645_839276 [Glomus cerebriforme]